MRILHILNDVSALGNGIVNLAVDLACAQAESGHTVAVASGGGGYVQLFESAGIRHFPLNQRLESGPLCRTLMKNLRTFTGAALRLHRITRSFSPDIVHCHMVTGTIIARVSRLNQRHRLVSHVHNIHQRSSSWMRLADKSIAVGDSVAKEMSIWGFPDEKVAVIRNGILGAKRLSLDYPEIKLEQPAILTVAGLWERKNIDGLISAFDLIAEEFPAAHLYIVGEGQRARYQSIAQRTKAANRIHFEGFKVDPRPYMRAAPIFVLASHRESFGLVLQEAREAGAAVIATDVDGSPEALDYGRAGILVAPGNNSELASAFRRLLSDERELKYWQSAARQNLEEYTASRMSRKIDALYKQLLPKGALGIPPDLCHKSAGLDSADTPV